MPFCDLYHLGFDCFVLHLVDFIAKADLEQLIHIDRIIAKPFIEWLRRVRRVRQARRLFLGVVIKDEPAN